MEHTVLEERRGSEELLQRLTRPTELSADHLKHLVRSVESVSGRILGWEVYGRPAFERLRASFSVEPEKLSAFVDHLVRGKTRFGIEVFPRGVPPLVDLYQVEVKAGGF